jgi:hypothetical protein
MDIDFFIQPPSRTEILDLEILDLLSVSGMAQTVARFTKIRMGSA